MERKFALLIGNSEYEDPTFSRLTKPSADVESLARVLENPAIGGFQVETLVNRNRYEVGRAIHHLAKSARGEDMILLYFSGHGAKERGILYFALRDTLFNNLRFTGLDARDVSEQMRDSYSRRQVILLDCCYSGAFVGGTPKAALEAKIGTDESLEANGYGRVILTATDAMNYALEGDELVGHAETSLFTQCLVEGLESGDADLDGNCKITVGELNEYIQDRMARIGCSQQPQRFGLAEHGVLIIAAAPPRARILPEDVLTALASNHAEMRDGAIAVLGKILRGADQGLIFAAYRQLLRAKDDPNPDVARSATELIRRHEVPSGFAEFDGLPTPSAKALPATGAQAASQEFQEPSGRDITTSAAEPESHQADSTVSEADAIRKLEHLLAKSPNIHPTVLDRLFQDGAPAGSRDTQIIEGVLRDLRFLLNRRLQAVLSPGDFPELSQSNLAYGLKEISRSELALPSSRARFLRDLEHSLAIFEPRLISPRVEADLDPSAAIFRCRISGHLKIGSDAVPVSFLASFVDHGVEVRVGS